MGEPQSDEKSPLKDQALPRASASYIWQIDPNLATQRLASLLVESSAHAALMIQNKQVWASAGSLEKDSFQEIASIFYASPC